MRAIWNTLGIGIVAISCGPAEGRHEAISPKNTTEGGSSQREEPAHHGLDYPVVPRGDVVDDYHGAKVPDPYRRLEDLDAPETRSFIEAENRLTRAFIDSVPARPALAKRLSELWDFERYSVPVHGGKYLFYAKNDGLQNQPVLYVERKDGAAETLIDPNGLSPDGTVALAFTSPSDDGRFLAYGVTSAGSDWTTIRIRDVETKKDLPEQLEWAKFSDAAWTSDNKGFFYTRFPAPPRDAPPNAPNYHQKLCYHRLSEPVSADAVVFERPDEKTWTFDPSVTDDGHFLVLLAARSTDDRRRVFYADLTAKHPHGIHARAAAGARVQFVELVGNFEAGYSFVGNRGATLYFKTNLGAPHGRIVAIDTRERSHPGSPRVTEIVPESPEAMVSARWVADRLVVTYLEDAHSEVRVFDTEGRPLHTLSLPGLGSVRGFSGRQKDETTYFGYTSFSSPQTVWRYTPATNESRVFRAPKLAFSPDDYVTRQVFATSKDGTKVPLFLTHRRDLVPDSSTPVYLYGYGGFNIPITPAFEVAPLAWMERGGVYAVANLRGGGEYGQAWHEAGMKANKENVFDDFIGAAQWLIENHVGSAPRLAIGGRSNGGLLVGACLTRRPDLFGAALPAVGVMDMLRYHKFTIGWAWAEEYGSSDDPADFRALIRYSPLHNIKPGTHYPATLITTADHDDRVIPSHSFKFAAALQAAQAGDAPILLRVETNVGHGAVTPTHKRIDEEADKLAFLARVMNLDWR